MSAISSSSPVNPITNKPLTTSELMRQRMEAALFAISPSYQERKWDVRSFTKLAPMDPEEKRQYIELYNEHKVESLNQICPITDQPIRDYGLRLRLLRQRAEDVLSKMKISCQDGVSEDSSEVAQMDPIVKE